MFHSANLSAVCWCNICFTNGTSKYSVYMGPVCSAGASGGVNLVCVFGHWGRVQTFDLFKALDILKIEHLFSQSCLKFVYKFKKRELPKYFLSFQCVPRSSVHDHDTRGASRIDTLYTRTHMAAKCIRSHLPVLLNDTPAIIINKIDTHSIQGFSFFIKRYYLSQYTTQCQLRGCFICNNWFFLSHFQ